ISSAVSFLSDPKVQSAPLAKKVSFLESKGMSSEEIEEAMARSSGKSTAAVSTTTTTTNMPQGGMMVQQQPGMPLQHVPPPLPPRPAYDWRDIFIAAVLAGGVGYGVWTLAKRLFGPWFKVPTQKELEEDKEKLDAQFQAVEDSLKEIKEQTNTALTTVTSQAKKVDDSINNFETVLKELKDGDEKRDDEFKNTLERNKEAQNSVLVDLQNEMKSLKSLLVSRRTAASTVLDQTSSAPTTPILNNTNTGISSPTDGLSSRLAATINSSGARAGIPAWQMANSSGNNNNTASSANTNEYTASPAAAATTTATTATTATTVEASGSSSSN
ncbi:MAG: peroxisomal membrane anchor protein conserved region-domain-containing protein, partial [Benjaminiella poitrasii]